MRILVCHPGPQFSVADVYAGWVEALRAHGVHVVEFDLASRLTFYESALHEFAPNQVRRALSRDRAIELAMNGLYAALYKTRPDVLLGVSGFFLTPELLDLVRASRTRVVLLHTESPYEEGRQLTLAPHADLNVLNDPTNLHRYQALAPTYYQPHCYREGAHAPGPAVAEMVCDLAFVGTGYQSRIAFLEAMSLRGLDVLLAGTWKQLSDDSPLWKYIAHDPEACLDNEQTVNVYRSARVGLNLYRREGEESEGYSMGPREIEMAACGLFFLREPRAEGDKVFPMLPTFYSAEDASEMLHYWLHRPAERREHAAAAREAIADRTFTNAAAELLRRLDRIPITA